MFRRMLSVIAGAADIAEADGATVFAPGNIAADAPLGNIVPDEPPGNVTVNAGGCDAAGGCATVGRAGGSGNPSTSSMSGGWGGKPSPAGKLKRASTTSCIEPEAARAISWGDPPNPARRNRCAARRAFHGPPYVPSGRAGKLPGGRNDTGALASMCAS